MWRSLIVGGLLSFDSRNEEVADASRLERAGRLKILELEEDATMLSQSQSDVVLSA